MAASFYARCRMFDVHRQNKKVGMEAFEPIGREENYKQVQEGMGMFERPNRFDAASCGSSSKGQTEASGEYFLIDIVVGFALREDTEPNPESDGLHAASQD